MEDKVGGGKWQFIEDAQKYFLDLTGL